FILFVSSSENFRAAQMRGGPLPRCLRSSLAVVVVRARSPGSDLPKLLRLLHERSIRRHRDEDVPRVYPGRPSERHECPQRWWDWLDRTLGGVRGVRSLPSLLHFSFEPCDWAIDTALWDFASRVQGTDFGLNVELRLPPLVKVALIGGALLPCASVA